MHHGVGLGVAMEEEMIIFTKMSPKTLWIFDTTKSEHLESLSKRNKVIWSFSTRQRTPFLPSQTATFSLSGKCSPSRVAQLSGKERVSLLPTLALALLPTPEDKERKRSFTGKYTDARMIKVKEKMACWKFKVSGCSSLLTSIYFIFQKNTLLFF